MNADPNAAVSEPDQDPGAPKPEELPPDDESSPDQVPDSEQPDVDDEGHMAPPEPERE
jgi:hypothetical protein